MGDIDLDAFEFGDEITLDPPRPVGPPRAAEVVVEAVRAEVVEPPAEAMQMTMEGGEVPHAQAEVADRTYLRALVYASHPKGTGEGHVVQFLDTKEGRVAICGCKSVRNLNQHPQGCWATIDARNVAGLPQPEVQ